MPQLGGIEHASHCSEFANGAVKQDREAGHLIVSPFAVSEILELDFCKQDMRRFSSPDLFVNNRLPLRHL